METQKSLAMYYARDEKKKLQLEMLCMSLGIQPKQLKASDLNEQIGRLAGIKGLKMTELSQKKKAPALFCMPEVIIFSGVSDRKLDEFLAAYKSAGADVIGLKAIVTPNNIGWTLYQLAEELVAESIKWNDK